MNEKQLFSAPEGWKKIIRWVFSKWTRNITSLTVAIYILGFLVVNAHLSQYGIFDVKFGNVQYLYGGGIFVVYLAVYYFFSGRLVIASLQKLQSGIYTYVKYKGVHALGLFSWLNALDLFLTLVLMACLGSSLFSSVAFSNPPPSIFLGCIMGVFLIHFSFIQRFKCRYPKICAATGVLIKIPTAFFFFHITGDWKSSAFGIFLSFLPISIYLNLLSEGIEISQPIIKDKKYIGLYTVLFLLILALSFGGIFYGEIQRNLGGGQPLYADIQIREEYLSLFPNRGNSTSLTRVKIVHTADKHIYIDENGEIIRIPDSSIIGVKIKDKPDKED